LAFSFRVQLGQAMVVIVPCRSSPRTAEFTPYGVQVMANAWLRELVFRPRADPR